MCSWTARRISVIARCAATPSTWDSANDVTACTIVAAPAASAMGISSSCRPRPNTSSMSSFVVPGSTSPDKRLTNITPRPSPSRPRRDQMRVLASCHASDQRIFFFSGDSVLPSGRFDAEARRR